MRKSARRLILTFRGDSDAYIVRGLVALSLRSIPATLHRTSSQPMPRFAELGLAQHLTPRPTVCAPWSNASRLKRAPLSAARGAIYVDVRCIETPDALS
jgi:hypothetical protein